MQHSEPSTHSPAVATLALHLPFLGPSRFARQNQGFRVKESVRGCDFASRPARDHVRLWSLTLVPTSFALVPDSQPTVAINRGQATTVLSEHRNKEQRKSSAPPPCLPCFCSVSCAQLSFTLEPDNGLCARMDERTCIRVITVDVTSSVQAENNKCSAVAMWMVKHKRSS